MRAVGQYRIFGNIVGESSLDAPTDGTSAGRSVFGGRGASDRRQQRLRGIGRTNRTNPERRAFSRTGQVIQRTKVKRGLWEAAATHFEKLLQQGDPVATVAPDLITALLNAHETLSPATVTRIEFLLAQLASAGHPALAQE